MRCFIISELPTGCVCVCVRLTEMCDSTPAATLPIGTNVHPNPTAIGDDHKRLGIQREFDIKKTLSITNI